jgi:hypothetical protein
VIDDKFHHEIKTLIEQDIQKGHFINGFFKAGLINWLVVVVLLRRSPLRGLFRVKNHVCRAL